MNSKPDGDKPLILITVGTDHHPFDRLIGWVDRWTRAHGDDARCVIQYGTSYPPDWAEGSDYLTPAQLQDHLSQATAVVSHGGPSTIMEIRAAGILPIVVPRDPAFGEHVDGHQMAFAAHLAKHGRIRFPHDEDDLAMTLDRAVDRPDAFRLALDAGRDVADLQDFTGWVNGLIQAPRGSLFQRARAVVRR